METRGDYRIKRMCDSHFDGLVHLVFFLVHLRLWVYTMPPAASAPLTGLGAVFYRCSCAFSDDQDLLITVLARVLKT